MENKFKSLISSFSKIDFGPVRLSKNERKFYNELNEEIILLCSSLPASIQTDALLLFIRPSAKTFFEKIDFFRDYYVPSWSILYWLIQSSSADTGLTPIDIKNAKTAHSMAMLLHAADDHLNDGDVSINHLALLLRSQSWMIMNKALSVLAKKVDGGEEIIQKLFDDYYWSITNSEEIHSLDSYCSLFRKQMATALIVPVLLTKKMSANDKFTDAIKSVYCSFGTAWRLLDDIKDVESDMIKSAHSSIYVCLSEDAKNLWDRFSGTENGGSKRRTHAVWHSILENGVIDKIKARICSELTTAARIADLWKMTALANELLCLLRPLKIK
ncbi:hypothetical protein D1BOALGB6SA_204 [Olavius sp. associated proteobacterium Delta 1]|nr:hypothetical protein D1BOALGB6SA_204 [Olavius sp. associated proteobacterium Delta 1]